MKFIENENQEPSLAVMKYDTLPVTPYESEFQNFCMLDFWTSTLRLDGEYLSSVFVGRMSCISREDRNRLLKKWNDRAAELGESVKKLEKEQYHTVIDSEAYHKAKRETNKQKSLLDEAKTVIKVLEPLILAEETGIDWDSVKPLTNDQYLPVAEIKKIVVKAEIFIPTLIRMLIKHVDTSNELFYYWEDVSTRKIEAYANAMKELSKLVNEFDGLRTEEYKLLDKERVEKMIDLANQIKASIKEIEFNVVSPDLDDIKRGLDTFSTVDQRTAEPFHARYPLHVREIVGQLEAGIFPGKSKIEE